MAEAAQEKAPDLETRLATLEDRVKTLLEDHRKLKATLRKSYGTNV